MTKPIQSPRSKRVAKIRRKAGRKKLFTLTPTFAVAVAVAVAAAPGYYWHNHNSSNEITSAKLLETNIAIPNINVTNLSDLNPTSLNLEKYVGVFTETEYGRADIQCAFTRNAQGDRTPTVVLSRLEGQYICPTEDYTPITPIDCPQSVSSSYYLGINALVCDKIPEPTIETLEEFNLVGKCDPEKPEIRPIINSNQWECRNPIDP